MNITRTRNNADDSAADIGDDIADAPDLAVRHYQVAASRARPVATTAANSVFDAGRKAAAAAAAAGAEARVRTRVELDAVQVQKGVPLPPARHTARANSSSYRRLLDRMQPGTHVELPIKQALGLVSVAKKFPTPGVTYLLRKLSHTHAGVWRTT